MSSALRSTSSARPRPMIRGNRAIGPPPATRPTPTSHCDRTAFSRLAKHITQAKAISLPLPVARPRIAALDTHENVGPCFQAGRALRNTGQIFERCRKIAVVQEESFDSAIENHDLE